MANKAGSAALAQGAIEYITGAINDQKMYGEGSMYDIYTKAQLDKSGIEIVEKKPDSVLGSVLGDSFTNSAIFNSFTNKE
jgi:hypothetical protein